VSEGEAALRVILQTLDPLARDTLRRVLIHDQADHDAIASQLLRYRGGRGDDWADIIDMLTRLIREGDGDRPVLIRPPYLRPHPVQLRERVRVGMSFSNYSR
jgi:hypothetical protein